MRNKIITESQLRKIIRETIENILTEDVNIDTSKEGMNWHRHVNIWKNVANEIEEKGESIINLPLPQGNNIQAKISKTSNGGILLEVDNFRKIFGNIGSAFTALHLYINNRGKK